MKVAHLNDNPQALIEHADLIINAEKLERAGETEKAIAAWKKVLGYHSLYVHAYKRLMILYRRLKDYKEELKVIEKAINIFGEHYSKKQPVYNNKVVSLSRSLLKATGLGDKKGNSIHQPGELTNWKMRKAVVEKKLKSTDKKNI